MPRHTREEPGSKTVQCFNVCT